MQQRWVKFSSRVVAFGLTAALSLGGAAALGSATFADEAYAAQDLSAAQAEAEASTTFTFGDDGIEATGADSGYKIEGTELTIQKAGVYKVTGSCADGSIAVKKGVTGVTIVLDNLTLAKDGDKAIKFKAGSSGSLVLVGESSLSTTNDKGIIKANAEEGDDGELVYDENGNTTGGDLVIYGDGTLNLHSDYTAVVDGETEDCDAINCEGDLTVLSGTFNIDVTDDGMHADNTLTIGAQGSDGPTINIANAAEGLEGATVNLLSGTGDISTTDDGVNAANKDLVSYGWQYGLNVEDGTWKVVAGGDGLDSNGNLSIAGGTTEVYCTGGGNGALDFGEGAEGEIVGTFTIDGGTLFAVGSDMMVTPSSGTYVVFGGQGGGMGMGGMQPGRGGAQAGASDGAAAGQNATQSNGQGGAQAGASEGFQPGGMPGAQGGTQNANSVVSAGEDVTVSVSDKTLYQTQAAASGSYVVFASDDLGDGAEATLTSGDTTTTATAGTGAANGSQFGGPGQGGQMPTGPGGQLPDGQQPGQGGPAGRGGNGQPPALPDGQTGGFPGGFPGGAPSDQANGQDPSAPASDDTTSGDDASSAGSGSADGTTSSGSADDTTDAGNTEGTANAGAATDAGNTDGAANAGAATDATGSEANTGTSSESSAEESSAAAASAAAGAATTTSKSTKATRSKNTMTVSKKNKTLKASVLASKAKTIKAITVKKAKGTVSYSKVSGSKYLKVNPKTGKITVKKGTPTGTYKIKVKVKAAGTSKYKAATKTVTVKVKVK